MSGSTKPFSYVQGKQSWVTDWTKGQGCIINLLAGICKHSTLYMAPPHWPTKNGLSLAFFLSTPKKLELLSSHHEPLL